MRIAVQAHPFDLGAESAAFAAGVAGAGAVVTFTGIVRGDGGLSAMEIEHYPGMTESALRDYAAVAIARFRLTDALVIHRHGRLAVGEPIMMVATAAPHRADAFAAADYLMDWLKSRAPFWKKEIGPDGAAWVAAKDDDERSLARWVPAR
jgi:molybdopterin synthase catalytic subunit